MEKTVSIYIRLAEIREGINIMILYVAPDFALSEAAILWKSLNPEYMSLTLGLGNFGEKAYTMWRIGE